ncbi:DUF4230 domain-containing protein [Flavihumibacter petaseus]|uniref:DUF4230 domain-containing protein n=1 Tax=Flavihumibacter petaseus NBRC 106054 TaxID=1220578 RepID=A0A0E9MUI4_9BACT|nr:DUF4230 domain-containing protein [Flavihumibacter petaseus]GAO41081.1 hypothetical protein FPE01S_01_00930 [Flavihumibacter petaseus NBRC 106054]
MIRPVIKTAGVLLAIALIYWLCSRAGWLPSPSRWFSAAPVTIDESPILVREIRKISQLVTLNAQDEVVVSAVKPSPPGSARQIVTVFTPGAPPSMDHLVIIVKGQVLLGTELKGLTVDQLFIKGDSISLRLPVAGILDIQTNPSDTETFIEEGSWSPAEVTALKEKARALLAERVKAKGLPERANAQALKVMETFLKTMGYKKVTVLSGN